ncbi:MAG: primosomal protein N' [Anaerolineae bacterium]|nr:primosomal protein N' [Anaerolineae bacterium]
MYAEIAVNAAVHQTFDYHVPDELADLAQVGQLVQVPFATSQQHGIILALRDESAIQETKPIHAILDPQPVMTAAQIDLCRWISQHSLMPIGLCLWLMLPPGMTGGRDIRVTLLNDAATSPDAVEQAVIDWLRGRGGITLGRRLDAARPLQGKHWRPAVERLAKEGILHVERILLPPRVRARTVDTAALAIHPDQIDAVARHLGKDSRRADVLEALAAMRQPDPAVSDLLASAGVVSDSPLKKLDEMGLVTINRDTRPARVMLRIPREQVDARLIELRGGEKALHILKVLARQREPIEVSWLYAQTDAKLDDLHRLEDEGLVVLGEKPSWRDSLADRDFIPTLSPPLTLEQAAAWDAIESHIKGWGWGRAAVDSQAGLFLLHGVTGSGKTEIYLRAIELTLAQGRGAIFLVPEIALTAQTIRRVAGRFPGQVAIVHSRLTEGERYDTWRRAREGAVSVIVGARSALFTPLPDVGLVILDEEHDPSYKQDQQTPYYHARDVAEQMMRQNQGTLILGSATPDVETVYRARRGELRLLELPSRILGHRIRILEQAEREGLPSRYTPAPAPDALHIDLPPVQIVDMREELKSGNTSIFSLALDSALKDVLGSREQAIVFINRRGQATYVFCRDCGTAATCPNCDTPLTYHRQGEALRCHRCGHQTPQPTQCPVCHSKRIKYFGAGTQQIEQAFHEHYPQARTLRWDADTATNPETHELYLQRFIDHKADVLIGTQMIAKGLDLPRVTLVGVVSADMGLNLPDFRAGERTFQLLTQVAGRAGRGVLGGRVVLQTYQPEHYAVQAAARHDFQRFYAQEIAYRRDLGYPPFRRLARIVFRDASETRARSEAESAAHLLRARLAERQISGMEIIGPAPCFFSRVDGVYRWHVLLRGSDPAVVLSGLESQRGWHIDIDPVEVL